MRRRNLTLAAVPLAALAIAGCGGGGDDDSTSSEPVATIPTTTAPSREELIAQGDAICAEVNAAVGSVGASETGTESRRTQVAGLYIGMVQSLDGLGTPEDASGFAEFSAAADELSTAESEVKLAAEREDSIGIEEAEANATPALEGFQAAADAYGFEDCSDGPSAPSAPSETAPSVEEEAPVETPEAEEEAPVEPAPEEIAPETGGAGGATEGGGTAGGTEGGGGTTGGDSGGIGPG
jgi:hypothetical protein